MYKRREPRFKKIVRSCITGNVVWIYRGASEAESRKAYWRACRAEVERMKTWPQKVAECRARVKQLLDNCIAALPINAELTKQQKDAIRYLQSVIREPVPCHSEFYDHIVEEARRRNERSARWRENRNKNFGLDKNM